jgi:hypothetical protein
MGLQILDILVLVCGTELLCIGELANLTTKIITLLEFFNFVREVSRLQYE